MLALRLAATDTDGVAPLFNGRDLTGWRPVNVAKDTFSVRSGMIVCTGEPAGFLASERQYENFILEFEWRHVEKGGNSGLFIWANGLPATGAPYPRGIEVQILDNDHAIGRAGAGRRWTTHGDIFPIRGAVMTPVGRISQSGKKSLPKEERSKPSPQWNSYRLECNQGAIRLSVNGKEVTVGKDCQPRKGYICLESEGSEVHFRNLRIKELQDSNTPVELTAESHEGFVPLFDGRGFEGWKMNDTIGQVWRIEGARFAAKASVRGKDLHLWTEKNYRNFELVVDWRLTQEPRMRSRATFTSDGLYIRDELGHQIRKDILDSGDSGIFLRGNQNYQVNIWSQPMGSGDIQEIHKDESLPEELRRAMLPKMKADAPFGEWNRFFITLKGERVTVVLNKRNVIDNALLPGIPPVGPIGLQYHRDEIEFANLFLKELP